MESLKDQYLKIILEKKVLTFGDFTTKSKRQTPYFCDTGKINSGESLAKVSTLYAKKIADAFGSGVTCLFGPAYKGIPLCVMVAEKLSALYGRDVFYSFNRKEQKDHGEGGTIVGHIPTSSDQVVITEDVLTAGTSITETLNLFSTLGIKAKGVVLGIDRSEKAKPEDKVSAKKAIFERYGVQVESLISLQEIIDSLWNRSFNGKTWIDDKLKSKIDDYRKAYCV